MPSPSVSTGGAVDELHRSGMRVVVVVGIGVVGDAVAVAVGGVRRGFRSVVGAAVRVDLVAVGEAVVVAVFVLEIGRPVAVGVLRGVAADELRLPLERVRHRVAVAIRILIVGLPVAVGVRLQALALDLVGDAVAVFVGRAESIRRLRCRRWRSSW